MWAGSEASYRWDRSGLLSGKLSGKPKYFTIYINYYFVIIIFSHIIRFILISRINIISVVYVKTRPTPSSKNI